MTYKIDTCCFLARVARRSALLGYGNDWLVQCQDTVTELDIRSWSWWPGLLVGQHHKVTMSVH